MSTDIKQAMHVEAGKSFGTAEANARKSGDLPCIAGEKLV